MVSWPCASSRDNGGPKPHKTVNIFLGYFFMVNFCLGTGFLGVPYSFFYAGYFAAIPTLALAAFVTWLTSTWLLEVMARAQALETSRAPPTLSDSDSGTGDGEKKMAYTGSVSHRSAPVFEITLQRKFEPVELAELFVGRWFKYVYLAVVTIYSFLACWSYSTVAGSAWASNIPYNFATLELCKGDAFHHQILPEGGCLSSYYFSVFLFGVVMIALSVLDLKEQAIVQLILGSARFLTVGAVVIYSIAKLAQGGDECESRLTTYQELTNNTTILELSDNATRYTSYEEIIVKFDPRGWVAAIPVFMYAYIIHTGISSLSHPVKQKKYLHWMLLGMSVTALTCYMSLGVVVPLWFKSSVQETITLNWGRYASSGNPLALRVLSYYLIFFPSLDVMSAFPLVVHCIVNNVYIIFTGRDTSEKPKWKYDWLFRLSLRLIAAILPLLAALGIANLIYVLKYAGLFGFAISLFFPAILQLRSIYVCNREFSHGSVSETSMLVQSADSPAGVVALSSVVDFRKKSRVRYETPYSMGMLSHPFVVMVIILIGACLFLLALTSLGIAPTKVTCSL